MYIPKHFEEKDKSKLIKFMREFNFAVLINYSKNKPWATHLPFIVLEEDNEIILKAHMAKSNPQWKSMQGKNMQNPDEVLVIFHEPHAYISPSLYDNKVSVPTWNYIAVHAYGIPHLYSTTEEKIALLELSFEHFEPKYREQWNALPEDYRNEHLDGIVGFEIKVTSLEGKFKLSQNRTESDRERVILNLKENVDKTGSDIAKFMEFQKPASKK
jgi:transcriptional regulator